MNRFEIMREEMEEDAWNKKLAEFKDYPSIEQMVNALWRSPDCYCVVYLDYEKGIKKQWLRAVHEGRLKVTDGL